MDRFGEMEVFAAVVESNGFTEAAKKLGVSKSVVSKHITSLEARLGVTLLHRTTRRVTTTEIGQLYYERAHRILGETRNADMMATSMQSKPMGVLRVSAATDFGRNQLVDKVTRFLLKFTDVQIEMELDNRFVDIIADEFDVAIRIGELADSSLMARKLAETKISLVASPDYLDRYGRPEKVQDLYDHKRLGFMNDRTIRTWRIVDENGVERHFGTDGDFLVNDGIALIGAVEAGLGISMLPCFAYSNDLNEGLLEKVLGHMPIRTLGIYAVYPPNDYVQPKLRAFIDFLVEEFKSKGLENW